MEGASAALRALMGFAEPQEEEEESKKSTQQDGPRIVVPPPKAGSGSGEVVAPKASPKVVAPFCASKVIEEGDTSEDSKRKLGSALTILADVKRRKVDEPPENSELEGFHGDGFEVPETHSEEPQSWGQQGWEEPQAWEPQAWEPQVEEPEPVPEVVPEVVEPRVVAPKVVEPRVVEPKFGGGPKGVVVEPKFGGGKVIAPKTWPSKEDSKKDTQIAAPTRIIAPSQSKASAPAPVQSKASSVVVPPASSSRDSVRPDSSATSSSSGAMSAAASAAKSSAIAMEAAAAAAMSTNSSAMNPPGLSSAMSSQAMSSQAMSAATAAAMSTNSPGMNYEPAAESTAMSTQDTQDVMQAVSPAMLCLFEAMDDLHSEVPRDASALAAMQDPAGALAAADPAADIMKLMAGGGAGTELMAAGAAGGDPSMDPMAAIKAQMEAFANPGANAEMDPQALFKAAEMLQMQAQWWNTAANISNHLPEGFMTFGIGPLGPMDASVLSCSPEGWRAMQSGGKGATKAGDEQPTIATQRVYTGFVKSFDIYKKGGFVECDELREGMQSDVYAHEKVLSQGRAGVGDMVAFPLHVSEKGKLQASLPLLRMTTNGSTFAQTGVFHPVKHDPYLGGEINCYMVKRVFGCFIRVSKELAQPLLFGRKVGFNFIVDAEGQCYATYAKTVADDYVPTPGDLTVSSTMDNPAGNKDASAQQEPLQPSVDAATGWIDFPGGSSSKGSTGWIDFPGGSSSKGVVDPNTGWIDFG